MEGKELKMLSSLSKRTIAVLLATIMLLSTACTDKKTPDETVSQDTTLNQTEPGTSDSGEVTTGEQQSQDDPIPPSNSLDLLTFSPASPEGQVLTEDGKSPQILITNYNETAIDALGRKLPTSEETGLPKENKYIGLFYSLWTADIKAPTDVSKVLAENPLQPDFGPANEFCFWTEPETGYHRADDVWQIKRDLYYFAMAGVDFLYIDMTNGYLYVNAMEIFLKTSLELRAQGIMTPYVVPWCYGGDADESATYGDMGDFYRKFMSDESYKDMWFYWEGKPLVLLKPVGDDNNNFPILKDEFYEDKLTFRKSWTVTGSWENYWVDNCSSPTKCQVGFKREGNKKIVECTGIASASFANYGGGRSGSLSMKENLDQFWETDTMGQGLRLQQSFDLVMQKYPDLPVLLISRWNEWIAQNFTQSPWTDTGFVDQFNTEFSRDIEPMKGGFTDNYFYQMCCMIRYFKGVLPADGNSGKQTVDVDSDFARWQNIAPVYTDFIGDTSHRDHTDTSRTIQYVNKTGRNDIVESRLTADNGMVYVYARTAENITSYKDGDHWMMLFLDADNDKTTGWEGYDFLINYDVVSDTVTTVCAYKDDVWQEIGIVNYRVSGNEIMIAIPRSLLGLTTDSFTLNFHWMDNVTNLYDLESWFTTGDSAPERRNNYTLSLQIPYDSTMETVLQERTEGTVSHMPAVQFSKDDQTNLVEGVDVSCYWITENYGKLPDFRLIAGNVKGTITTGNIAHDAYKGFTANYALSFDGYVKFSADGSYTFTLKYDDGVRLYIDERLVINCEYDAQSEVMAVQTASCTLRLAAGYHAIRVEYAEVNGSNATLSLECSGELYTVGAPDLSIEMTLPQISTGEDSIQNYLPFDGNHGDGGANAGAEITDKDGFLIGVSPEGNETVSYVAGYDGTENGAVDLSQGYVVLSDPMSNAGTDDFTLAFWLNTMGKGNYSQDVPTVLFANKNSRWDQSKGYFLAQIGDKLLFNMANEDDGHHHSSNTYIPLPAGYRGQWIHVTLVVDRGNNQLLISYNFEEFETYAIEPYGDSVYFDSNVDINSAAYNTLTIGCGTNPSMWNKLTETYLDEFMYVNGTLTSADLQVLADYYGEAVDLPDVPVEDPSQPSVPGKIDLTRENVTVICGETIEFKYADICGNFMGCVGQDVVLRFENIDWSEFSQVKIQYATGTVMALKDAGCFIAITNNHDSVGSNEMNSPNVLAYCLMENITTAWYSGAQTMTIDIPESEEELFLAITKPDTVLNIYSIEFIP